MLFTELGMFMWPTYVRMYMYTCIHTIIAQVQVHVLHVCALSVRRLRLWWWMVSPRYCVYPWLMWLLLNCLLHWCVCVCVHANTHSYISSIQDAGGGGGGGGGGIGVKISLPPMEWFRVWLAVLQLVTQLLSTLGHHFLSHTLDFMGAHQERITQVGE